jgi:hypothetical protein
LPAVIAASSATITGSNINPNASFGGEGGAASPSGGTTQPGGTGGAAYGAAVYQGDGAFSLSSSQITSKWGARWRRRLDHLQRRYRRWWRRRARRRHLSGGDFAYADTAFAQPLPTGVPNCVNQGTETITDGGHNLEDSGSAGTCGLSTAKNDKLVTSAGLASAPEANGGTAIASTAIGVPTITTTWKSVSTMLASGTVYALTSTVAGDSITCTDTATGAYGAASATSSAVTVTAATSGPKIALTGLKQSHRTWAEKKRKHGPPVGTKFTFTLNAQATVALTFTTKSTGRKPKRKCVAPIKKNKKARHRTSTRTVGSLSVTRPAGKDSVVFSGRVGRRKLTAGKYEVTVTAKSSTGTSHEALSFTIKR